MVVGGGELETTILARQGPKFSASFFLTLQLDSANPHC